MSEHSAECNRILNTKRFNELFKVGPLGAIAGDGKAGQAAAQAGGGSAQCEITSLIGHQSPEKDQFEFFVARGAAHRVGTQRSSDAIFRAKKQLVAVTRKFSVRLG